MHKKQHIRKIVKNGRGSYYINIPKEIIEALHMKERQKLVIELVGKHLKVKDWKK